MTEPTRLAAVCHKCGETYAGKGGQWFFVCEKCGEKRRTEDDFSDIDEVLSRFFGGGVS